MSFYQVERSKKANGWIVKKQGKGYKYTRVRNSPSFPDIAKAEKWIKEYDKGGYPGPWIDHKIGRRTGHLMALQDWKDCCDEGGFIDYDGYGRPVNEEYEFVNMSHIDDDYFDVVIFPSDYTDRGGKKIPEETKYIHWYNR